RLRRRPEPRLRGRVRAKPRGPGGHARSRRATDEAASGAGTLVMVTTVENRIGPLLRDWRRRRRLSQLDLALEAGGSPRPPHFFLSGRTPPPPAMEGAPAERPR